MAVTGGLNTDTLGVSGPSTFNGLATFNDEITTDSITVTGAAVFDGTSTFNGPVVFTDMPIGTAQGFGAVGFLGTTTTVSIDYSVPGVGQSWDAEVTIALNLNAPLVTGTITLTGTGGTGGDGYDAYSLTLTNPGGTNFCLITAGRGASGQTLIATVTITGGTILNDRVNAHGTAIRIL
jgi:hypothetical protein